MDEIVLRGVAKWPNVPAVYGWLSLNRRGDWLIRGEHIGNPAVAAYIGRNYEQDERGRWFFQNGPQRVFVTLDYTPFVYRIVTLEDARLAIEAHNGKPVTALAGAWIDETGVVLLATELGVGVVHDRDLSRLLPAFVDANGNPVPESALDELMELLRQQRQAPLWLRFREADLRVNPIRSKDVPRRFGFVACPVEPAGREEHC